MQMFFIPESKFSHGKFKGKEYKRKKSLFRASHYKLNYLSNKSLSRRQSVSQSSFKLKGPLDIFTHLEKVFFYLTMISMPFLKL